MHHNVSVHFWIFQTMFKLKSGKVIYQINVQALSYLTPHDGVPVQ